MITTLHQTESLPRFHHVFLTDAALRAVLQDLIRRLRMQCVRVPALVAVDAIALQRRKGEGSTANQYLHTSFGLTSSLSSGAGDGAGGSGGGGIGFFSKTELHDFEVDSGEKRGRLM